MNTHSRRYPRLFSLLALVSFSAGALAGSNLPAGYPGPACGEHPITPERPEKFETEEAIAQYNARVDAYNASMERLFECVREYVSNAADDIRAIEERSREAIDRLEQKSR